MKFIFVHSILCIFNFFRFDAVFRELLSYMLEDPRTIGRAIRLTFIAKYLERIGDQATNVCEMVVYLVEGKVIKHSRPDEDGEQSGRQP